MYFVQDLCTGTPFGRAARREVNPSKKHVTLSMKVLIPTPDEMPPP